MLLVIADGIGKAHPQSQMAGSIFIKKGVIKQQPALADRRVIGHQGTFAQIRRAFVHADQRSQQLLIFLRMQLDDLAAGKPKPEALDQLPLVGQRHRGMDNSLCFAALGGDKALLGRDICIEENALAIRIAAALKLCLRDHADTQVRPVAAMVFQRANLQGVEVITAAV